MKYAIVAIKKVSVSMVLVIVVFSLLAVPLVGLAQAEPLVPPCNTVIVDVPNVPGPGTHKGFANPCGWNQLVDLARRLLNFMVYIAVPIAAIAFAYAGWLYLSARGNPSQITQAHGIFLNVLIGIVIILIAWLVVRLIFDELVQTNTYIPVLTNS